MKYRKSFPIIVFLMAAMSTIISCKRSSQQQEEEVVYYYPQKNVYWDARSSLYYYSLDGGEHWDSLHTAQPASTAVLGPSVKIQPMGEDCWLNNEEHRRTHNAVLINVVNDQTILLAREDSIKKIKPIVLTKSPRPEPVVQKEEVPKKGIKKFFSKIFGKKKNPSDEGKKQ